MTIAIESVRCLDGPSIWTSEPVTQIFVDIGPPDTGTTTRLLPHANRLSGLYSLLAEPSSAVRPLSLIQFSDDQRIAGVIGTLALDLQRSVGIDVAFTASPPTAADRVVEVVVQHADAVVGAAASKLAVHLLNDLANDGAPDLAAIQTALARFGTMVASRRQGTAAQAVIASARLRGIPVSILDPFGQFVDLGNGAYRRRLLGSLSSFTSVIAESIVNDKHLANHYLRTAGVPVPHSAAARTAERAVEAARTIGFPVVVKPLDAGNSLGLFVDRRDEHEVRQAFPIAAAASSSGRVLVEQYIAGNEYRAMVVNDQVVAVSERVPAYVMGDGQHTIRRLIDVANADPRRGTFYTDPLTKIVADAKTLDLLRRQDLHLDAIPRAGQRVKLKPTGQISTGGISIDRTGDVHPDNLAILRQAARVVELDIATMDLVAPDIAQSFWTAGGAIIEINTRFGYCSVAVVTALSGLTTPIAQPVETVLTGVIEPTGALVINADDPGVTSFASGCGVPLVPFSLDPRNELVRSQIDRGGMAVVPRPAPEGDQISIVTGEGVTDVVPADLALERIDALPEELGQFALLAAVAALCAHAVPVETIRQGLAGSDLPLSPD